MCNVTFQKILKDAKIGGSVNTYNRMYQILVFADDIGIVTGWYNDLKEILMQFDIITKSMGSTKNENKLKYVVVQRIFTDDLEGYFLEG